MLRPLKSSCRGVLQSCQILPSLPSVNTRELNAMLSRPRQTPTTSSPQDIEGVPKTRMMNTFLTLSCVDLTSGVCGIRDQDQFCGWIVEWPCANDPINARLSHTIGRLLQFLTSLAVTCRCNSSIKDKKVPSEKLLPSWFRVPPSLSAILSERLRFFCFCLFLHYRPHSLSFLAPFPLRLKLHRAQTAAVVCLLPVLWG